MRQVTDKRWPRIEGNSQGLWGLQATKLSLDLVMHSAFSYEQLMEELSHAAQGCLGVQTSALLRQWVAAAAEDWLHAEHIAQCPPVCLHGLELWYAAPALWSMVGAAQLVDIGPAEPYAILDTWIQVSKRAACRILRGLAVLSAVPCRSALTCCIRQPSSCRA